MAARTTFVTAAQATAAAMRKDVLATGEDGLFLGSEHELLERYGVSRPTLRQAARILEHEQLITVRRGVNGGIFTRLPTSEAVTRVAAVFLQANNTTVDELYTAVSSISTAIARMAAANPSDAKRLGLYEWVRSYQPDVAGMRPREFLNIVTEFGTRIVGLIDCPPLELFQNVLLELTSAETSVNMFANRDHVRTVAAHHLALATAVRDGLPAEAERLAREQSERGAVWLGDSPRRMTSAMPRR